MSQYKEAYFNEIKEQRATARGAKHRKRGSKTKKCTLPSDYLTQKELASLNGEVKVYKLGQPMPQEEYDKLPEDLKPLAKVIPANQAGGAEL